jgi:hypothetical protein
MKTCRDGVVACAKLALLAWALICYAASASAAEWEYDPRIVVGGVYDDNHRLDYVSADKIAVTGTQGDAGVEIHGQWPTWDLLLWPYISETYYPGHTDQDDGIESLQLRLNHIGQRTKTAITANYSQRTLLTELLPTTDVNSDLGEPTQGTNPGLLEQRNRQDQLDVTPQTQIDLTQRSQLVLRADYINTTYSQQTLGYYVNYSDLSALVGWAFELSPRGTLTFNGSATQFSPSMGADAQTYGLQVQWYKLFSETAKYYVRVGVNRTNFGTDAATFENTSSSATDVSSGAGVSWAFQVTSVFLDLTRSVNPSPSGVTVEQDQLRFRLERRFTPKMAAFVGIVGVKQDPLGNPATAVAFATSYASGTTGFEWRFRREFALVGAYTHIWQKLGILPSSAASDTVRISFVYEPHRPEQGPAISVPY